MSARVELSEEETQYLIDLLRDEHERLREAGQDGKTNYACWVADLYSALRA